MTLSSRSSNSASRKLTFRELIALTPAFQQVVATSLVKTPAAEAVARELYDLQLSSDLTYEAYYELLEETLLTALPELLLELSPTLSDAIKRHLQELKQAFYTDDYEQAVVERLLQQSGDPRA